MTKKVDRLRGKPQTPTETMGWGEWWWYEDKDGIRVCHYEKGRETAMAFFSWPKIKGAMARKKASARS